MVEITEKNMTEEVFNPLSLLYLPPEAIATLHPNMVEAIRIAKIWFDSRDEAYNILEQIKNEEVTKNFYFILKKYLDHEVDDEFLNSPRENLPALGFSDTMIAARDAIKAWEAGDRESTAKACLNDEIYDIVLKFTKTEDLLDLENRVYELKNPA